MPKQRRKADKQLVGVDALLSDLRLAQRKLETHRRKSVDPITAMDELYEISVHEDHYRRMADLEKRLNGSLSPVIIK